MSTLPVRVRKARVVVNLSQAELARRIGVKRSAVTQWEHPAGTKPSVAHLIQIAIETNSNFEWLATGRGPSRSDGGDSVPAVTVDDYARDEVESQALAHLRHLSSTRRKTAIEILRVLAG
ncbi:MAG: helix-turn-helix domain-containing protein [Luteimonas sp.]